MIAVRLDSLRRFRNQLVHEGREVTANELWHHLGDAEELLSQLEGLGD